MSNNSWAVKRNTKKWIRLLMNVDTFNHLNICHHLTKGGYGIHLIEAMSKQKIVVKTILENKRIWLCGCICYPWLNFSSLFDYKSFNFVSYTDNVIIHTYNLNTGDDCREMFNSFLVSLLTENKKTNIHEKQKKKLTFIGFK